MFMEMFMPSTPVLLLGFAVLAVLLTLAWFVGGMAPNQRVTRREAATNADKGASQVKASQTRNADSSSKAA